MDHRVVTVHVHSNENDLNFEKKNKKNYKIEKKENDVDRFLYCNIFIYFQIKTSFKEKKKEFVPESKCCTLRKVHFHLLHLSA